MSVHIQGFRVLLKPEEIVEKFESELDLVKPESTKEQEVRNLRRGIVVQVGDDCYVDTTKPWCKPGDVVLINPQAGFSHTEDGAAYLIVNEEDILAVIGG